MVRWINQMDDQIEQVCCGTYDQAKIEQHEQGNVFMIDDDNGLIMYKEWKKVFTLVNIEPLSLVIVTPKKDFGKHGVR